MDGQGKYDSSAHGGHIFMRNRKTGEVIVLDESPGVDDLTLDASRPILLSRDGVASVPVIVAKNGRRCHTITNVYAALEVAEKFGLRILAGKYEVCPRRPADLEAQIPG